MDKQVRELLDKLVEQSYIYVLPVELKESYTKAILALISEAQREALEKLVVEHDATCGAVFAEHERNDCNFRELAVKKLKGESV